MKVLHLANTDFEWELEGREGSHPKFLELELLPLQYMQEGDGAVTSFAHPLTHHMDEGDFSTYDRLESWGASPRVRAWAHKKGLDYPHPPFSLVRDLSDKTFVHRMGKQLPHEALLQNGEELALWEKEYSGQKILKSVFGLAGRGHCFTQFQTFAEKEWKEGRAVIGQAWVKRLLDFSTQWHIGQDGTIEYLGSLEVVNNKRGGFVKAKPRTLPYYRKQKKVVEGIASMGFFGHLGIDGMVYEWRGKTHLHPILEINPRKTMGFVALKLQT